MALIKCRECGKDVSAAAKTCPSCGIKDPKGRDWRSLGIASVATVALVAFCQRQTDAPHVPTKSAAATSAAASQPADDQLIAEYNARREKEQADRNAAFAKNKTKVMAQIQRALAAGDSAKAYKLVVDAGATNDPDFKKLSDRARTRFDADQTKIAKAEARKQGVTIGMTKEQVLGSSWGKPSSVNRSIYAFGTHEQWVYDRYHNGYLYFENDVLTSIQN